MERLIERLATARAALATLNELVRKSVRSKVERDAATQRFEYTFEATWKAAQLYLREVEGLEVGSPKRAARAALQVGLFDAAHTRELLAMADDRNLTVHTYNEPLAEEIASRLSGHAQLLQHWLGYSHWRIVAHSKMGRVDVSGRGSVLVHFLFEPCVVRACGARGSARVCHELAVALSATHGNHEPLVRRGKGRNGREPRARGLRNFRQACEVGRNLADLLIRQVFVGHKGRHDSPRLTDRAQKLRLSQRMSSEIRTKSTLSVDTVTKFAIVLKCFPHDLPRLSVAGRSLCKGKQ